MHYSSNYIGHKLLLLNVARLGRAMERYFMRVLFTIAAASMGLTILLKDSLPVGGLDDAWIEQAVLARARDGGVSKSEYSLLFDTPFPVSFPYFGAAANFEPYQGLQYVVNHTLDTFDAFRDGEAPFATLDFHSDSPLYCGFNVPSDFDSIPAKEIGETCFIYVLSAIFGNHDYLRLGAYANDGSTCYRVFMDREAVEFHESSDLLERDVDGSLRRGVWKVYEVRRPYDGKYGPNLSSRIPKILPHRLFPHASYFMWVDAKLQLYAHPLDLIAPFLTDEKFFLIFSHPVRHNIFEERDKLLELQMVTDEEIRPQMKRYSSVMHPNDTCCLYEGRFFVLRNEEAAQRMMCAWFSEMRLGVRRDQVPLPYVITALGYTDLVHGLPSDGHDLVRHDGRVFAYNMYHLNKDQRSR